MKTTTLFLDSLLATFLSGFGAHALANRCDPTARGNRAATASAAAASCTLPCMSCAYLEA